MEANNFFFYDLETSGLNAREDRIMQFAGQRTTLDLEPMGEPVNILVKMTDDALPSPGAIMVTKITPQDTLQNGILEAEFVRVATEEIFTPGTVAVGYNTVRFDDEFMRACLWRNFCDPYEWEWKDGRSRWDMLDVVRLTRALRPEGIEWPFTDKGKPTNRLELLTKLNGLEHSHAHDALSDVFATIAVAKMIREKQPKLFDYLFKMRSKNEVKKMVNLDDKKAFVYASGRYSSDYNKTTVAFPLTAGRNGNVLVYDLRYNLEELMDKTENATDEARVLTEPVSLGSGLDFSSTSYAGRPGEVAASGDSLGAGRNIRVEKLNLKMTPKKQVSATRAGNRRSFFPIVKELCYNKCPAVAPLSVLENGGWEKIGLDKKIVEQNLNILLKHPEFAEQMREELENRPEFPAAIEPEAALYDGFLNDNDRVKVAVVRNMTPDKLADFHPDFIDERLPELLLHYKGRNFPKTLSDKESAEWEKYRKARLERQAPGFLSELELAYQKDEYIAEELKLYYESLMDYD